MKAKVIEIRWNDKQPIYSTDFHSLPPTQHLAKHPYAHPHAHPAWRLATCGGDNKIRLWLVHPRPPPAPLHPTAASLLAAVAGTRTAAIAPHPTASTSTATATEQGTATATGTGTGTGTGNASSSAATTADPRVEYLATLSQHQGVVNCVRFSPNGDALASAGDDGNILIWVPGEGTKSFGEPAAEDLAFEKESWRVKGMIRSLSGKEIYDLAWSPCGSRILAGSVDHTATIYDIATCSPLYRLAEHTNYVQGVAWDPRGGYIATQSSDRTMHVYQVCDGKNGVEVHPVGKNSRMQLVVPPSSASAATATATVRPRRSSSTSSSASSSSQQHRHKLPRTSALAPASTAGPGPASNIVARTDTGATAVFRPPVPRRSQSARSESSDRSSEASSSVSASHPCSTLSAATTATATATATATKLLDAPEREEDDNNGGEEKEKEEEEEEEVVTAMDPPQGIPHHPPAPSPSPQAQTAAAAVGSSSHHHHYHHHARSASGSGSHSHSHSRRSSVSGSGGGPAPIPGPQSSPRLTTIARSPSPALPLPAVMPPPPLLTSPKIAPAVWSPEFGTVSSSSTTSTNAPPPLHVQSSSSAAAGGIGLGLGVGGADSSAASRVESVKLYSDANSTHFFRRLAWSPDGALLLTPAGLWEDPYAAASVQASHSHSTLAKTAAPAPAPTSTTGSTTTEPKPTVYVYSRSNLARPPVAHLPGHRTTSLGIRFCPVLWQLRDPSLPSSLSSSSSTASRRRRRRRPEEEAGGGGGDGAAASESEVEIEQEGVDDDEDESAVSVQLTAEGVEVPLLSTAALTCASATEAKGKQRAALPGGDEPEPARPRPRRPRTLFDLPYRMVYAVATLDSVYLYDTQQAGPLAMFGNLHYAPFTDLTWSPDGQTLVVSSQDGYCSVIAFEPGELGTPFDDDGSLEFPLPRFAAPVNTSPAAITSAPSSAPLGQEAASSPAAAASAGGSASAAPVVTESTPQVGDKRTADAMATPAVGLSPAGGVGTASAAAGGEPELKKVKKRVAPTLIKPLS